MIDLWRWVNVIDRWAMIHINEKNYFKMLNLVEFSWIHTQFCLYHVYSSLLFSSFLFSSRLFSLVTNIANCAHSGQLFKSSHCSVQSIAGLCCGCNFLAPCLIINVALNLPLLRQINSRPVGQLLGFYYFLNQSSLQYKVTTVEVEATLELLVHKTTMPLKPVYEHIDPVLWKRKGFLVLQCPQQWCHCVMRLAQCDTWLYMVGIQHEMSVLLILQQFEAEMSAA